MYNAKVAEQNKQSAKAFFHAIEECNIDKVLDLFAYDGVQFNPYCSGIFPEVAHGHDEIREYWKPAFTSFDGMKFPIHEVYAMENCDIVYVHYSGEITLKENSGVYRNDYFSIIKFDDSGKIQHHTEIFNPIIAAKELGLMEQLLSTNISTTNVNARSI
ncbi:nuclear transport factor 2 family protein [Bacterioplanoides sp.]|uniref:nuclear transport factor 2 family protein n=1 Tax=Bacterioplanoides sp. TaxID=2066072 RepID=UPI003AFFB9F1